MEKTRAKAIMIQGTMSNAGKSMLVSGLCHIFAQDGYRVAPFKSQNMALNSFITEEGLEMGRAQVVQAEAAGILPSVDMNPILLKPTTDVGSQVIVNGISRGNMKAKDYFAFKKELIPEILEAYHRLSRQYDIIVIEGAGSPAEINLKADDIVNMGMAKMADAPVLLVGDIDRGGVFAQLYGTVALLTEDERDRVKGLIINKFRGDKSILDPGCDMLEDLCHIPVVGTVPYMEIDIEDEDSLSSRLATGKGSGCSGIDLAVIRFPRISNFTDFNVFSSFPGVQVRYVSKVSELGHPDMVFLPGTKSTIEDLIWMRQCGLEAAVLKLADCQVPVWGICGGYQMMGEMLKDQEGVESQRWKEIEGMGLLPLRTEFHKEKIRTQVEGVFGELEGCFKSLSGLCITGYEVHMGESLKDGEKRGSLEEGRSEGRLCRRVVHLSEVQGKKRKGDGWNRGNIYGSYVHGVFDSPEIAQAVIQSLADRKGLVLEEMGDWDYKTYREKQYDKLADVLRKTLDMDQIYSMIGEKGRTWDLEPD